MLRWEPVEDSHGHMVHRARVPGGWIYRWDVPIHMQAFPYEGRPQMEYMVETCFVPEPGV